jgi:hypothetical protein
LSFSRPNYRFVDKINLPSQDRPSLPASERRPLGPRVSSSRRRSSPSSRSHDSRGGVTSVPAPACIPPSGRPSHTLAWHGVVGASSLSAAPSTSPAHRRGGASQLTTRCPTKSPPPRGFRRSSVPAPAFTPPPLHSPVLPPNGMPCLCLTYMWARPSSSPTPPVNAQRGTSTQVNGAVNLNQLRRWC